MKKFENPEIIIKAFEVEDVIATSPEVEEDMGDWA